MARLETPPPDDARLPGFEWVPNDFNSGGTYTHRRWRIVLHRTDTLRPSTAASARAAAAAHPNPPHIWFGWAFNGEEIADQTIRLDRSARALRTAGGRSFNKDGALQVELWDKAAPSVELPDWQLRRIAEAVVVPLARWAEAHGSTVELATRPLPGPGLAAGRYGETAPHRMGIPEWDSPSAERVLAHYDPPGQTHWDTGTLDVARLVAHAIDIMNGDDMPLTADDLAAIAAVVDARVAAQLASVVTPRFNWEENVLRTHVTDREDVALPDGTVATDRKSVV